ncbi:MAG: hypothetical protein AABZ34_12930 [Nitrospirota bacterium]
MVSSTGIPAIRSEWTNWHLLFATQPEPDLEFTEEDLDESVPPPAPPMNSPKRSGKKPLLWILLLLLVGGVGYVAMDPDGAMQLVEPYLDGGAEPAQPAIQNPPVKAQAPKQAPTVTPPAPPVVADNSAPAQADVPAPSSAMPAPAIPAPAMPALQPATLAPKPVAPALKPTAPTVRVAGPLYAEGQRVTVIADPTRPKSPIPLFVDSVGTKTSTTVLAGATLTILDGDYQTRGWVYAVRAQDGRKGWISERNLRLKR